MIPCYVCGKDASTGWTKGFVPARDSQKFALCAEHNTPENRLGVAKAWDAMLVRDMAVMADVLAFKAAVPSLQTATVHFTGGGMLTFTCLSCSPTEQGTLCLETAPGARSYIPMQHIREYSIRPYFPEHPERETTEDTGFTPSFPPSSVHPEILDTRGDTSLSPEGAGGVTEKAPNIATPDKTPREPAKKE